MKSNQRIITVQRHFCCVVTLGANVNDNRFIRVGVDGIYIAGGCDRFVGWRRMGVFYVVDG